MISLIFGVMIFGDMIFGDMIFGNMIFRDMIFGDMLFGNMLPSETNQHLFSWSITASCVADFSSYRVLSRVSLIITWPKNYVCRFLISYFH